MSTVDKPFADNIIKHGGWYNGDSDNSFGDNPRCVEITEYDSIYGGVGYGMTFEGQRNCYVESEFVRNPRCYWSVEMTDKSYSEMTDAELAAAEREWLGNLADASGPSSAFFASKQCDLIRAEIDRREKMAIETQAHASTIAARETRDNFRAVLSKAATRYDPVSFEAGERSMRKRAAALVEAHSDLPATTKINVIKAGFARRLTVSILALPTGEK